MTLTNLLILINVIVFVWESSVGGINSDVGQLFGADVTLKGEWWRIVTSAFIHANIMHIAFNMFALYQLGNTVETVFGRVRFALIYFLSMFGAGFSILAFAYMQSTAGASGAIFGLFGALIAVGLRMGGAQGRTVIMQVVPIVALNLVFTFAVPGISIAGHLGGLVTGLIAGLLLFRRQARVQSPAYAYAFEPQNEAVQTIEHPPIVEHPE